MVHDWLVVKPPPQYFWNNHPIWRLYVYHLQSTTSSKWRSRQKQTHRFLSAWSNQNGLGVHFGSIILYSPMNHTSMIIINNNQKQFMFHSTVNLLLGDYVWPVFQDGAACESLSKVARHLHNPMISLHHPVLHEGKPSNPSTAWSSYALHLRFW